MVGEPSYQNSISVNPRKKIFIKTEIDDFAYMEHYGSFVNLFDTTKIEELNAENQRKLKRLQKLKAFLLDLDNLDAE